MNLSEFTTSLKGILGVTELKTIPELTEDVYKLVGLPDIIKDVVADRSTSFDVPDTVPRLRPYVFAGCTVLQNATLPANTKIIPEGAFLDCPALKSVTIPAGVTTIERQAFKNNASATGTLVIPNTVTAIGNEAFSGCGFSEIQIPCSVGRVGVEAFANCPNLEKVTFVDDVCSSDNPPSEPDSWESKYTTLYLASRVFANSPKLTCITMPDETYNRLSPTAFEDSSLTAVYFREMRLPYTSLIPSQPTYDPEDHHPWVSMGIRPDKYPGIEDPSVGGVCEEVLGEVCTYACDTCGREPWGGQNVGCLYGIWFVKNPCIEEILPCYYTYQFTKSNERWVCEEDGEPCEYCSGNKQIADYALYQKVFKYNSKPDSGWTVLEESYRCYRPADDKSRGYNISYDTYERIPDDLRLASSFEKTEWAYIDGEWEHIGWIESNVCDDVCGLDLDAPPQSIRPIQENGVDIPCIVSFYHTSHTGEITEPQYFKLTGELTLTSLCLGGPDDPEYPVFTDVVSPDSACVIKTSLPEPVRILVIVGDVTGDVAFTGVPVDLGPFTVITNVDQTT